MIRFWAIIGTQHELLGLIMITQDRAKELFDYKDGHLVWKARRPGVTVGTIAGRTITGGYRQIRADGGRYLEHKLVFLWHFGYVPKIIDHINRIRNDNRIENLREATASENQGNRKINKNNTSGYKGIHWRLDLNKWSARISINGKREHLGHFDSIEDARQSYCDAAKKHFGNYANI